MATSTKTSATTMLVSSCALAGAPSLPKPLPPHLTQPPHAQTCEATRRVSCSNASSGHHSVVADHELPELFF